MIIKIKKFGSGQMLVELLLAIGLAAVILPALLTGLMASREGKPQQEKRVQAIALLKETEAAVRSVRDTGWTSMVNGTYHPVISGSAWALASGASVSAEFTQQVVISDVYRDSNGAIVAQGASGSILDLSTKKADITISWSQPNANALYSTIYVTRVQNHTYSESTKEQFDLGQYTNLVTVTGTGNDGAMRLSNNNKAKWCSPAFNNTTLDLPDGPPVAVSATASAVSNTIPNDVFVATAPNTSSTIKLAHINVPADVATPTASLRGKFTMDASQFAGGYSPQVVTGLDNNFRTTDVVYYRSGNNTYALLGTNLATMEVLVVWVNDGNDASNNEFQDPVNKIYKLKTFFNTKRYSSVTSNDQSPYGYGASTIATLGTRGYVASGGYLYVFNLSSVDSATTSTSLPMLGCRIQLDGYECNPGSPGTAEKYDAGESGTSWGDDTTPIHNDCSDGGNIELKATNDIDPVQVGSSTYVFAAIGGVTNPEFAIVNATTPPSSGTSLTGSSCGRTSSSNSSWRRAGTLDFNNQSGTEEAANSVFAKADGTRAYISSNGGIDGNSNGQADSKQFYVINTSNKSTPAFLSGSGTPSSGYYEGGSPAPAAAVEMYPRRSMTVLNGERAVLVGSDAVTNGNDAEEYQVLSMDNEATPTYCSGVNYDSGFNDLTYVSEKDYETYIYMIANTTLNELKIIEGGPDDAIYVPSGSYESAIFDTASVDGVTSLRAFNRLLANVYQPANTTIEFQVAVAPAVSNSCTNAIYSYVGPGGTTDPADTFTTTNYGNVELNGLIPLLNVGNYNNPGRCLRYKIYMETLDQMITPYLYDITWNYSL